MASNEPEIVFEFPPMLRIHKDGHVERLLHTETTPPGTDPHTGVSSKDITILPETNVTARVFSPNLTNSTPKLPLLVYFHGGGFCLSTPASTKYHNYLNTLVAKSKIIAVSVNYRKAPENPIPAAYDDSWAALDWIASHSSGNGPKEILNYHADFERVFLSGDSAGANIAHNMAMALGDPEAGLSLRVLGVALIHPYFWGKEPIGSEAEDSRSATVERLWPFICPSNQDNDDLMVNPVAEGERRLAELGCGRALVCVAEKDVLRDRGWLYYEALSRSGWLGVAEIFETQGEDHAFHLNDLGNDKAQELIQSLANFFNRDMPAHLIRY